MESGVDDAGLHSPLLGGYTATEAPPNTPHGAQGSSTTPSALPQDKTPLSVSLAWFFTHVNL